GEAVPLGDVVPLVQLALHVRQLGFHLGDPVVGEFDGGDVVVGRGDRLRLGGLRVGLGLPNRGDVLLGGGAALFGEDLVEQLLHFLVGQVVLVAVRLRLRSALGVLPRLLRFGSARVGLCRL